MPDNAYHTCFQDRQSLLCIKVGVFLECLKQGIAYRAKSVVRFFCVVHTGIEAAEGPEGFY